MNLQESNWIDRLDRRFGGFGIPHLPTFLAIGQLVGIATSLMLGPQAMADFFDLRPAELLQGEVWRLVTFLVRPPTDNIVFALIAVSAFHLTATALERTWGTFPFTLFIAIGWALNVAVALAAMFYAPKDASMSVGFLQLSVLLAFAWLYPEFEFSLYFLIPIQVKYLAFLAWAGVLGTIGYGLATFREGGWLTAFSALANIGNFLLFFAPAVVRSIGRIYRRVGGLGYEAAQRRAVRHTCAACGANNITHPDMEFRYCTKCTGTPAYCEEHLRSHEHK